MPSVKGPPTSSGLDRFRGRFKQAVEELTLTQKLVLFGILVGVAAGVAAFVFDSLIVLAARFTVDPLGDVGTAWRVSGLLLLPALGASLGAVLLKRFCPGWTGHGVNEVLQAIRERSGRIEGRVAWVKSVASALTIGFGGSAGREGPVIQIGASAGSWVGQRLRVSDRDLRVLAAAGAAAGLGAAFGTPLTAVFFTMEVLLKDLANEAFAAVVISSVTGVVTSRFLLGSERFMIPLADQLRGPFDLGLYALVGLLCAPLGTLYMRLLVRVESWTKRTARADWWMPAVGGLTVGVIAIAFPRVMGTGQHAINEALRGALSNPRVGALSLLKLTATVATLGTGGPGGAMMPSLFIGSMAGAAWGGLIRTVAGSSVHYGACALMGMSTVFTAAYQAPVTGMVLALEISHNYELLLPTMVACTVSHIISRGKAYVPTIER